MWRFLHKKQFSPGLDVAVIRHLGEWNFDHYVKILSLTYSFHTTIIEDHINYGAHCKDYNNCFIFEKKQRFFFFPGDQHLINIQT